LHKHFYLVSSHFLDSLFFPPFISSLIKIKIFTIFLIIIDQEKKRGISSPLYYLLLLTLNAACEARFVRPVKASTISCDVRVSLNSA